jgi:alpha-ketoglutarate-dependent taurine dioxygenase
LIKALNDHQVIFIRGIAMTPDQHLAFSRIFGQPLRIPHAPNLEGYPDIQTLERKPGDATLVVGASWHCDSTYLATPPGTITMRAVDVPEVGGDTLFANLYLAFEALSPKLQKVLSGLKAVHSAAKIFGKNADQSRFKMNKMNPEEGDREVIHPVVRTHPATGRRSLFVNSTYTRRFDGMTEEESQPLLKFLYEHAARPEFTCRVRWHNDTTVIWDNRCTYHHAVPDYAGKYRYLERVTLAGEAPA